MSRYHNRGPIARGNCKPGSPLGIIELESRRATFAADDERFRAALYRYGLKHGLPNLSRSEILARMQEAGR